MHVATLRGILTLLRSMLKLLVNSLIQGFDYVEQFFIYTEAILYFLVSEKGPQVLLSWYKLA